MLILYYFSLLPPCCKCHVQYVMPTTITSLVPSSLYIFSPQFCFSLIFRSIPPLPTHDYSTPPPLIEVPCKIKSALTLFYY